LNGDGARHSVHRTVACPCASARPEDRGGPGDGAEAVALHRRRGEPGAKAQAHRLVALCYPDAYEIGISNQALQILYTQVNARESFAAERVYCPWPDMADAMRAEGIPLFTLETGGRSARSTCSASRCRRS
jgi:hypothetical protein